VSVLDGDDIVYVARVPTSRIMTVAINVGTRFPAYATSMGRVLLAGLPPPDLTAYLARVHPGKLTTHTITSPEALRTELEQVRAQGYAIVDQELEQGLRAIAAPIHDRTGAVTGAVNISVQATRTSTESMRQDLLPALLAATTAIDADLRNATPPRRRPPT
jgi:IclR family pca regulon transcriptional regulator